MDSIKQLEQKVETWVKPMPHLPVSWRNWISENIWWMTLIAAVLSVMGIFATLGAMFSAMSLFGFASGVYGYMTPINTGWWMISTMVSLVSLVLIAAISAMAVSPLKSHQKKGWDLLFLILIVNTVSSGVSILINFNFFAFVFSVIWAAISAFISAYFLFEIRSYFVKATSKK